MPKEQSSTIPLVGSFSWFKYSFKILFFPEHHTTRLEGLEEARERDTKAAEAWIGKS